MTVGWSRASSPPTSWDARRGHMILVVCHLNTFAVRIPRYPQHGGLESPRKLGVLTVSPATGERCETISGTHH